MNNRQILASVIGVIVALVAMSIVSQPVPVSAAAGPTIFGRHTEVVTMHMSFVPELVFYGVAAVTAAVVYLLRTRRAS